jgi:diguanylate cyclase (GGDEF)-like protein
MADAPGGGLWVGTDAGLSLLNADTGALLRQISDFDGVSRRVFSLLADRRGVLWVGTDGGLFRAAADGSRLQRVSLPERMTSAVTTLFEDDRQRVWVGTRNAGVAVLDASGKVLAPSLPDRAIERTPVTAMAQVPTGEIWIGTRDRGVLVVDPAELHGHWLRNEPLLAHSLDDDDIWALHVDRSGLMWVGSSGSLLRHNAWTPAVLSVMGAKGRATGLMGAQADAVLPMSDGRVWVGNAAGISVLDPWQSDRVQRILADSARPERALPETGMFALLRLADGSVHAATDSGLYRIDPASHQVRRVHWAARDPAKAVWALLDDGDALWVGGHDGVWHVRSSGTQAAAERFDLPLPDQRVEVLAHAREGQLWVGTRSGLFLVDIARRTAVPYLQGPWVPPGLGTVVVNAVFHDVSNDRLWLGTASQGILVVDAPFSATPRVSVLDGEHGLLNLNISALLPDAQGRVWASTDDGLVVVDSRSLAVKALGPADGVQIATYWAHSAAVTPEGELLFGGLGGLTVVRPDRLRAWSHQPTVMLTQLWVDGEVRPASALHASQRSLVLAPHTRSVAVEFSSLDLSAPERNRYAYRLLGFDDKWTEVPATHRVAAYTNLPPGDYRLQIRGSNREQAWSAQELDIALTVQPAWHQTAAFRSLLACAAMAALYAIVQARTLWLRRQRGQLEALVGERTAALEQRTAELLESQRKLADMAYTDPLTGLANRRQFERLFSHQVATAKRQGVDFALALVDLDRFKQINDTLGHAAGDALLVEVARRLVQVIREPDAVARLGGDEFALLISGPLTGQTTGALCERILAAFEAPVHHEGREMRASLSIGIAAYPRDGDDLDPLCAKADAALYSAKAAGRNTWRDSTGHQGGAAPARGSELAR